MSTTKAVPWEVVEVEDLGGGHIETYWRASLGDGVELAKTTRDDGAGEAVQIVLPQLDHTTDPDEARAIGRALGAAADALEQTWAADVTVVEPDWCTDHDRHVLGAQAVSDVHHGVRGGWYGTQTVITHRDGTAESFGWQRDRRATERAERA
jgi:hypothetical protein